MLLWLTSIIVLAASVVSTWIVNQFLTSRIAIAGSFIGLERSLNPDIAFSLRLPLQSILIPIALVVVIILAIRSHPARLGQIAFGLIIGGALGNILDRLYDGVVTDFIQVGTFPVFNIADSCITVGAVLLLISAFKVDEKKSD